MYKNFLRVASANLKIKLLNVEENKNEIIKYFEYAGKNDIDLVLFPELTLTGVSAGDPLATKEITEKCVDALDELIEESKKYNTLFIIGSPIRANNKYFNTMLFIKKGKIINNVVKNNLTFEEKRIFSSLIEDQAIETSMSNGKNIENFYLYKNNTITDKNSSLNLQLIFENELLNNKENIEKNINMILVPGSLTTNMKQMSNIKNLLTSVSNINSSGLIYAGASNFESSGTGVYASQKYIIENGNILEEGRLFNNGIIISEINMDEIQSNCTEPLEYSFNKLNIFVDKEITLRRKIDKYPYFPKDNFDEGMKNILEIQSEALARRLRQIPDNKIFIGISGGLDSTLGLIVASLAYYKLGLDSKNIFTITMPGLGTSDRTKNNAINLSKAYNTSFKEINIVDSVKQHFKDIDHDENDFSVTYENSQARERTQVLMDLSNKHGGIVLGTGNMSEIALGWATFNGDHMSMYNVNCGLPKTMLREVVRYVANNTKNDLLKETLMDIIDTPISPELLPTTEDGNIAQKTEDNVGPYELHDFFLYHLVKNKSKIEDIKFMTIEAFSDKYNEEIIVKYLSKFLWRLQTQQFKRNTAVDGPQLLEYSLNSRLGFVMPSDIDPNSLKL